MLPQIVTHRTAATTLISLLRITRMRDNGLFPSKLRINVHKHHILLFGFIYLQVQSKN